ncbi:Histidine kinase osmosensor [Cladophialophora chaetospira]|uniref:histidine kinase n=1 Tax=Cladophialophora chaetospira TaxID=386627 RepID=A0AA38XN54_9EURO|nr:Histidine kinase osmosensor [Cladophialophora chaetospira]
MHSSDQPLGPDGLVGVNSMESHHFVTQTRAKTLEVTADLKATQIAGDIGLYEDLAQAVSTRSTIQALLKAYRDGNHTVGPAMEDELRQALSGGVEDTLLLQGAIYPPKGPYSNESAAITMVTSVEAAGRVLLPRRLENGEPIYLGDSGEGYPVELYPNLTWTRTSSEAVQVGYENHKLDYYSTVLLGPLYLTDKNALISMTVAINNNTSRSETIGWLTILMDARLLYNILFDPVGLEHSGVILLVGPVTDDNLWKPRDQVRAAAGDDDVEVWFILPPNSNGTVGNRHAQRSADPDIPFFLGDFPTVADAYQQPRAGSNLLARNEEHKGVSCGYAKVNSNIVDWVVVFEESRGEVFAPINALRNTIIACVLGVCAVVLLVCFPLAHWAVKPIRALRIATRNSILTYEAEIPDASSGSQSDPESLKQQEHMAATVFISEKFPRRKKPRMHQRREFKIPEKVPERHLLVHDELSDLTNTFNQMSGELQLQYARLEDRVKVRTAELEKSRDLARAANESKTLFIANVSHELRTPLNGIIGMCSIAMQEEEISRVRQSLSIIYKSSDLLLHLLNDLLTFSRNSFGQQLSIEQGFFRLGDIGTQLMSIFAKQARDKKVSLKVVFQGVNSDSSIDEEVVEDAIYAKKDIYGMLTRMKTNVLARGPADTGPLRDMTLVGDKNRILQILMNLVSNSMKFTNPEGMIEVRLRCRGFVKNVEIDPSTPAGPSEEPVTRQEMTMKPSARRLRFEFECEDTGPGIPEDLHQEIFKPFVQGDLALSRKHGGTGLGLAICAQLATLMGGGIHLRSTVGIGSTFTCSIPLGYTKEKVPSIASSLNPGSGGNSLKPPSLTSSIEVLSARSVPSPSRIQKTRPKSAQGSRRSLKEEHIQAETTRIVGYSHPYLTVGTDDERADVDSDKRRPPNSRRTSQKVFKERLQSIQSQDIDLNGTAEMDQNHVDIQDHAHQNGEQHGEGITEGLAPTQNGAGHEEQLIVPAVQIPTAEDIGRETSQSATIDRETSKTSGLEPQSSKSSGNPHILVAEDNKVNQEVIMRMLKLEKVTEVTLAEDGLQAVDRVRESMSTDENYSLIFMDIQMPNLDGIQATKQIREMGFKGSIVALTAFDHESNRDACWAAGVDDFMGKPVKRKLLRETLQKFAKDEAKGETEKGKAKLVSTEKDDGIGLL